MTVAELIQKLSETPVAGFDVVIASKKRGEDIRVWVNDEEGLVTLEAVERKRVID